MTLQEHLKSLPEAFDEKFRNNFNIGVVPDDMTKQRLKDFLIRSNKETISKVIDTIKSKYSGFGGGNPLSFDGGYEKAKSDLTSELNSVIK